MPRYMTSVAHWRWKIFLFSVIVYALLSTAIFGGDVDRSSMYEDDVAPRNAIKPTASNAPINIAVNAALPHSLKDDTHSIPCWRKCSHRKNKIVYPLKQQAGLSDRGYQFQRLLNLAGYLCASLEVPPPSAVLSREHNLGIWVSKNLTWDDDFWEYRFEQDSSKALFEIDPLLSTEINGKPSQLGDKFVDFYKNNDVNNETVKIVITRSHVDFERDFEEMERYSFNQQQVSTNNTLWSQATASAPFVWIIQPVFYALKKQGYGSSWVDDRRLNTSHPQHTHWRSINNLDYKGKNYSCGYIKPDDLPHRTKVVIDTIITGIANETMQAVDKMFPIFFHLRRGDSINACNTTLARVKSYIDCTFNNTESQPLTVLFDTDEQDPAYRTSVISMLGDKLPHIHAVDIGHLIRKQMQLALDNGVLQPHHMINMIAYLISTHMKWTYSNHALELRRHSCRSCDRLSRWMGLAD